MEQNTEPSNEPSHIESTNIWQGSQQHTPYIYKLSINYISIEWGENKVKKTSSINDDHKMIKKILIT